MLSLRHERFATAKEKRWTLRQGHLSKRYPARVAEWLAVAKTILGDLEAGAYLDCADAARKNQVSRARLCQLMALTFLAPDIQEELLFMEVVAGKEPLTERTLRRIGQEPHWGRQRILWQELKEEKKL